MADTKITDLTSGSPALSGDELVINRVSGGPLDRKITVGDIATVVGVSGRLFDVRHFTTTGSSWTAPATALSFVIVECIGGGASGVGPGVGLGGAGGGAGGYARRKLAAATVGAVQTITMGTGGAVGATGAVGTAGSSTSFGTLLTACGGAVGVSGANQLGGSGGLAICGDLIVRGGDGGSGFNPGISGAAIVTGSISGAGGGSYYGSGGGSISRGFTGGGSAGRSAAGIYGAGGGGGSSIQASGQIGGIGGGGLVVVWEFI